MDESYDELFVFILGKKQNRYSKFICKEEFSFNADKHILDFRDLLRFISFLPSYKIKRMNKVILEENANPFLGKSTNRENSVREI